MTNANGRETYVYANDTDDVTFFDAMMSELDINEGLNGTVMSFYIASVSSLL